MGYKRFIQAAIVFTVGLHLSATVAQTGAIKIIVGYPAGATSDALTRVMADGLSKRLNQAVIVENKPGAGGNLGGADAARAAPDGYTIFMTTSGIQAINPVLYTKMPFDPNKDLMPVAPLVALNNVLVVHPAVKANFFTVRSVWSCFFNDTTHFTTLR